VFYDVNANNAYDSDTDNLVVNETFSGTAISLDADHTDQTPDAWDANGNLLNDGTYKYTYDAWNRLVKATLQDASKVVQVAEYDGLGRRIRKVVNNAGDLDGTTVYYYNGQQMIETRDGSGNVLMQVIHGTRYIDEVVQLFLQDAGRVYVHQDANYNVTTLTDITGRVLERSFYSPYGQLEAVISKHPFDYDDDGDVDADDASMIDADCSGDYSGDCRRLDADGDRDIAEDDLDIIAAYIGGLSGDTALTRVPSSPRSRLGNPFAHQGLPLDAEIASYQNRARQYNPGLKRFMQREDQNSRPWHLRYSDGYSLYSRSRQNPLSVKDPNGIREIHVVGTDQPDGGSTTQPCEGASTRPCDSPVTQPAPGPPDCPGNEPGQTTPGDGWCYDWSAPPGFNIFHPGAHHCYRSYNPPGGHCCYNESGELILDSGDDFGPAGGETADGNCVFVPAWVLGHLVVDVVPYVVKRIYEP